MRSAAKAAAAYLLLTLVATWPLVLGLGGQPPAQRRGLLLPQGTEGHVHVAVGDVDAAKAGGVGGVTGDVAGALAVADDPDAVGPALFHGGLTRQGALSFWLVHPRPDLGPQHVDGREARIGLEVPVGPAVACSLALHKCSKPMN